mmetsp:Transcript_30256/g.21999  ORF Transcript_30256/g.21999 Transcript_30256/m.21999 type:complete len:92 (+) Transcript_30256:1677-1952(+)
MIASAIGGKDDRSKSIRTMYLNKIPMKSGDIEQFLRNFLSTYRLAGVDSQVVMLILEQFSFNFFDRDDKKIFVSKEEAYEFAYLLIVLQTV